MAARTTRVGQTWWIAAMLVLALVVVVILNLTSWYQAFERAQREREFAKRAIEALAHQQEWRLKKVQPGTQVFSGMEVRSHARFPLYLPAQPDSLGKLRRSFLAWVDLRGIGNIATLRPRQVVCLEYEVPGEGWLYVVQAQRFKDDPPNAISLPRYAMAAGFFLSATPGGYRFTSQEMEGSYLHFWTVSNPSTTYQRLYQDFSEMLVLNPPIPDMSPRRSKRTPSGARNADPGTPSVSK